MSYQHQIKLTRWNNFESTVEPRYNEGSRHWQNLFAISRFFFSYILLYNTGVKKIVGYPRTSLYRDSLYRGSTVQICRTLRPRPLVRIWTNRNKLSVHTKSVNLFTETTSFRISLQSGLRALSTRLRVKKIRGFKPFRFRVDKSQWYMRRNVSGSYAKQYGE